MDIDALIGQTLVLGYWAVGQDVEVTNRGLVDLVSKYRPGGVILFKHNVKTNELDPASGEIRWLSDLEVVREVSGLTARLQSAAAANHPALPLLILIDQEGGGTSHLKQGVTRIPNAIQIGASRDAWLAYDAGRVVGDELMDLGINTVLAPVVDVNNNNENDVIGRRAYGAHPSIVSPLGLAFARGLQSAGALSIAKHYPGHGSSQDDPHWVLPVMGYDDRDQFEQTDLAPFRALMANGIDGVLSAHILVEFFDSNEPATFSQRLVEEQIRKELAFDGLVFTDDLSAMQAPLKDPQEPRGPNRRSHEEVVAKAYQAGNDVLVFGYVLDKQPSSTEDTSRVLTGAELERVFQAARDYFDGPGLSANERASRHQRLERSVERILVAKSRAFGSWDNVKRRTGWTRQLDEVAYMDKLEEHAKTAERIARSSLVLISEEGKIVNELAKANYFSEGKGPLTRDVVLRSPQERVTVVSPVFRDDELTRALGAHWLPPSRIDSVHLVYGFYSDRALEEASRIWGEPVERLAFQEDGVTRFNTAAIERKVAEVVATAAGSRVVVFGVLTSAHIEVLKAVCERFEGDDKLLVVLLFREPYFVPSRLYDQRNTVFLFVPALPSMSIAGDALFGELLPHPVSHLPVSVPGKVNRNISPGAPIAGAADFLSESPPPPVPPGERWGFWTWVGAIGLLVWLGGAFGGLAFFAMPRGRLRWTEEGAQYNLRELVWCLLLGLAAGSLIGVVSPLVTEINLGGVALRADATSAVWLLVGSSLAAVVAQLALLAVIRKR